MNQKFDVPLAPANQASLSKHAPPHAPAVKADSRMNFDREQIPADKAAIMREVQAGRLKIEDALALLAALDPVSPTEQLLARSSPTGRASASRILNSTPQEVINTVKDTPHIQPKLDGSQNAVTTVCQPPDQLLQQRDTAEPRMQKPPAQPQASHATQGEVTKRESNYHAPPPPKVLSQSLIPPHTSSL
jgi:hypothetical protein